MAGLNVFESHSRVPEELSEDHEVGRVQRDAHVSGRDGENSHAALV